MSNNKSPKQKQPGEKKDGLFHYNPGNMSGKSIGTKKDEPEQKSNADSVPLNKIKTADNERA